MKSLPRKKQRMQKHTAILLDLLSPLSVGAAQAAAQLDTADIQTIAAMARQHRLGPLLHWIASKRQDLDQLPPALASEWSEAREQMAIYSLMTQRSLALIHDTLTQADIPYIALKGSFLAFHAYPEPGLRPLRDIDILVPQGQEITVFRLLQERGAQQIEVHDHHNEAVAKTAMKLNRKHLPPLRCPENGMVIEVHSHLFHADKRPGLVDLADDPKLWNRRITLPGPGSRDINFMEQGDLLLHLIVHAVFDHRFDNGPLTLSDIAFLVRGGTIDWPAFWDQASRTGCTRGAILALRLAERHWGPCGIDYASVNAYTRDLDETILSDTAALMLRNFDVRKQVEYASHLANHEGGIAGAVQYSVGRLFRQKLEIAEQFSIDPQSPRIFLYYLRLWVRLITCRNLIRFNLRAPDVRRLSRLKKWLND